MRVVCPTCNAAYDVPAPVVAAGRTLRCTACGSQFPAGQALPPELPPDLPPSATPPPAGLVPAPPLVAAPQVDEAARLLPAQGEPPAAARAGASPAVLAGWALSLVVLSAGAAAAVAWRQQIMVAWPPSTRAYAALGYHAER